ncbi:helix-turn-helix domain-containing protein [Mycolicibacterium llatzerense]|nr:helix-turn-helix domain-containing protein [Mycolicibacterium llatzerense]
MGRLMTFTCTRCQKPKDGKRSRGMCHACYMAWHSRQTAYGRFESRHTPAGPVRAHITMLLAAGLTIRALESAAGVNRKSINKILRGSTKTMVENAEKLLALQPPAAVHEVAADHQPIDATGTRRRLQALIAYGYTQSDLAARLGITDSTLSKIVVRDGDVLAVTARNVATMFDALQTTPGTSARSRRRGAANRWPVPMAWDEDTIDDPGAQPAPVDREKVSFLDRYDEMRHELGISDVDIARKLGMKFDTLLRQLQRYDLPVSAELASLARGERNKRERGSAA